LEIWISSKKTERILNIITKIQSFLNITECTDSVYDQIKKISEVYCLAISKKWKDCSRNKNYLLQRHHKWLNKEIQLFDILSEETSIPSKSQLGRSRGRPQIPFENGSLKTKRRRVQDLVNSRSSDELCLAATLSQKTLNAPDKTHPNLSPQDIIALYLDLDLSERKYLILRTFINSLHKNYYCFPSVKVLRQMKRSFLPSSISVTEISAEVELQDLLNVTTDSILKMVDIENTTNLKLICKWGFDGSSGHSIYKQKFTENSSQTDEFMFVIAFVPLKLVDIRNNRELWVNLRSSSTFFCRPIKFIFMKENEKLVREQESFMIAKIENLFPYIINSNDNNVQIDFQLYFTMLDGSVSNILSNTNATSKCFICGATPKEMNSMRVTEKLPNTDNFRFGLSTLHCWIRFFECLLHISYRLSFKKWQVRGEEYKKIFECTKKQVQENFKTRLGLIVDKPKPGYGTSNDGNTARRFFSNSEISSQITGIDKNLIDKFYLILRVLSSGKAINTIKFKILLQDTLELYLALYSWYYMPSSVHKVLIHGCDVINYFDLPIGLLSEEALEARHKEIRKNRLYHTRKTSREDSNRDLMNILLLTSDPLISSRRKNTSKKSNENFSNIQDYLVNTDSPSTSSDMPDGLHDLHLSDTDVSDTDLSDTDLQ
jgi:hypothetical protein